MNPVVYKQRSIDVWLGRNFEFNYVNTENEKPSLPCPVEGCICCIFCRIFDNYHLDTWSRMLSRSRDINENNNEKSWQWDDWDIKKIIKDINEKINCIAFCKMRACYTEPWFEVTSTKFETFSKSIYNRYIPIFFIIYIMISNFIWWFYTKTF